MSPEGEIQQERSPWAGTWTLFAHAALVRVALVGGAALVFLSSRGKPLSYDCFFCPAREEGREERSRGELAASDFWNRLAPLDGQWYLDIALGGYRVHSREEDPFGGNYAFFPLFPLVARVGRWIGVGELPFGCLLNWVLGPLSAAILAAVAIGERIDARRATWLFLSFPTAAFTILFYSESVFLFLSFASALCALRGRYMAGGILGAFAALTRPHGALLSVLLVGMQLEGFRSSRDWRDRIAGAVWGLWPAFACLAWMLYLQRFLPSGDSGSAFLGIQARWGRYVGLLSPVRAVAGIPSYGGPPLDAITAGLYLAALIPMWRKLRPSLAAYATGILLLSLVTGTALSFSRFALSSFPLFLVLAKVLERPRWAWLGAVVVSFLLQAFVLKGALLWLFVG